MDEKFIRLTDVARAWEENGHNVLRTARALEASQSTIRRKLMFLGLIDQPDTLKRGRPPKMPIPKPLPPEQILGMTRSNMRTAFNLVEGNKVWVEHNGKAMLKTIKRVNPFNIETTNKYGRTECFTYGDIITGYYLAAKGEKR